MRKFLVTFRGGTISGRFFRQQSNDKKPNESEIVEMEAWLNAKHAATPGHQPCHVTGIYEISAEDEPDPDRRGCVMGASLKAFWAREHMRRKELPEHELLSRARREVERRLARGKSGESKPRLRVFDHPRGGVRYVLYAGRHFIRARTWERVIYRAAFGPWSRTPPQFIKRKAPRPPCTKPTATIRHASSDQPMQLSNVKRDDKGRVVSGYVENGNWWLRANHDQQVFWSEEHPELATSMANFSGWEK